MLVSLPEPTLITSPLMFGAVAAAIRPLFMLAAGGVLDGRPATTTWWLAPFFRQLHPQVQLDESRMLVPAGAVVTADIPPNAVAAGVPARVPRSGTSAA